MGSKSVKIEDLMAESGVKFGTSGARGLAVDMTDEVCYAYTWAFIQYLEEIGQITGKSKIAIGGDLRASTDRIMSAAARAVEDRGHIPENCGKLPTPALANYGIETGIPTVMVTGSHIPEDRNGIKYTRIEGEILKEDESGIKRQVAVIKEGVFDKKGMFLTKENAPSENPLAATSYVNRYVDFFPKGCLRGKRIAVYQHSAVGRDQMVEIFKDLGAEVTPLGFSDIFIPVDTEAIRQEDVDAARKWAGESDFDTIVSTDGDSDRPLISDERGKWLRGDIAGILTAAYLEADAVATPVSCNSALEKCCWFKNTYRTRIGSPYVIEGMQEALKKGFKRVVGYEANGGFLIASDMEREGKILKALPTRDAVIVHLAVLLLAMKRRKKISELLFELPLRVTFSDRLKNFPTERSFEKINGLLSKDGKGNKEAIEGIFGKNFGRVAETDTTDGLRITFESSEVVHFRPSGNAPEFRCYNEADTESRAMEMNRICMDIMSSWRNGFAEPASQTQGI